MSKIDRRPVDVKYWVTFISITGFIIGLRLIGELQYKAYGHMIATFIAAVGIATIIIPLILKRVMRHWCTRKIILKTKQAKEEVVMNLNANIEPSQHYNLITYRGKTPSGKKYEGSIQDTKFNIVRVKDINERTPNILIKGKIEVTDEVTIIRVNMEESILGFILKIIMSIGFAFIVYVLLFMMADDHEIAPILIVIAPIAVILCIQVFVRVLFLSEAYTVEGFLTKILDAKIES